MLSSEEVITRSKQITELGIEIQKAYAMQFEYRAKAEEMANKRLRLII